VPAIALRTSRTLRPVPSEQPGLTLHAPLEDDDRPVLPVRPPAAPEQLAPRRERRQKPPKPAKRQRLVARRVRRTVRRFDPWSVLKVSLVFYVCGYIVAMVAGVLLWNLGSGAVDNIESFIKDYGTFEVFEFKPDVILRVSLLLGAIFVVVLTGLTVLAAVLFNLISDLVGGIRVVVLEEESARPATHTSDTVSDSDVPDPRTEARTGL